VKGFLVLSYTLNL